jgi:hypothetical protein
MDTCEACWNGKHYLRRNRHRYTARQDSVARADTEEDIMKGYAIAHLRTPTGNDEVYD